VDRAIGFTGRRPNRLGGYGKTSNPYYSWVVEQIGDVIERSYAQGFRRYISGMALGFDKWVAQEILARYEDHKNIVLVAAVPFPSQPAKWNEHDQEEYYEMLDRAEIQMVGEDPWAIGKLMKRNEWIVDNSEALVACWDEKPDGGTWNCIAYARKQGKPVYVINYLDETCRWMNRLGDM
jgi:uncharacterized phage-like protein YoqJ